MLGHQVIRFFSKLRLPSGGAEWLGSKVNAKEAIEKRLKYLPSIYRLDGEKPLVITQGSMQFLYDHTGQKYLDLDAGSSGVILGHSHPIVTQAVIKQSQILVHTSSIYMNQRQGLVSKMIIDALGPGYECVYLCNSTGQANDFACFLARLNSDSQLFSIDGGYYGSVGHSRSATNIGHWSSSNIMDYQLQRIKSGLRIKNAEDVQDYIQQAGQAFSRCDGGRISGLIYEPIQLYNRGNIFPHHYLSRLDGLAKKYKGLTICDETNTGLGRVGKAMWGFKFQNIQPNMVTISKSLSNGIPFGAVVTTKQIASKINFSFFNTFSGGHVQLAATVEVLNQLKDPKTIVHVENVGLALESALQRLKNKHWQIQSVRGRRLCLSINFDNEDTAKIFQQNARERHVIVGRALNTITVTPPLCITQQDVSYVEQALEDALLALNS